VFAILDQTEAGKEFSRKEMKPLDNGIVLEPATGPIWSKQKEEFILLCEGLTVQSVIEDSLDN
jgi:hypothetical protein